MKEIFYFHLTLPEFIKKTRCDVSSRHRYADGDQVRQWQRTSYVKTYYLRVCPHELKPLKWNDPTAKTAKFFRGEDSRIVKTMAYAYILKRAEELSLFDTGVTPPEIRQAAFASVPSYFL